jgi:hypothetical protein
MIPATLYAQSNCRGPRIEKWCTAYNVIAIPVAAGLSIRWRINLPMSVGSLAVAQSLIPTVTGSVMCFAVCKPTHLVQRPMVHRIIRLTHSNRSRR